MQRILFILFLFPCLDGIASFNWNTNCRTAYTALIELRFSDAQKSISAEKKSDPSNNIVHLLENYIDMLTLVIGEEKNEFYLRQSSKRKRLKCFEDDKTTNSAWRNYCIAETELQWAFSRIKFGENISAAKEINKAYHLLEKVREEFPDFLPAKKSMGLLHCLIGSVPEKYQWITDLKGLKGSVPQGRRELEEVLAASSGEEVWLKEEVTFFLSFILQNLDNDEQAANRILKDLELQKPLTPLSIYASASIAMRSGKNLLASKILEGYQKNTGAYPFHYLEYMRGLCLLHELDTACRSYFKKYLLNFKGRTFIKAAYQKLAWSCLVTNDTTGYKNWILKVEKVGTTITDEDKLAWKEFKDPMHPHPVLLRSRILFDGGNYRRAFEELTAKAPSAQFNSVRDLAESGYRLGRIYHEMGKIKEGTEVYVLVVNSYGNKPWYFAASAALNLGLISENNKDKEKAEFWFRKCLAMKGHEYKESLDQKAQAGLNRLKNAN